MIDKSLPPILNDPPQYKTNKPVSTDMHISICDKMAVNIYIITDN